MSNPHHRNSASNKMLIDATHPEETRVVVLRQGRVEEFDYESAARKLLRGNIYLAKVTRVEPSLQAAFVDYGGNRHGFLAFNEIHPDYYQIPIADRRALIEAEAQADAEEEAEVERAVQARDRRHRRRGGGRHGGQQRRPAGQAEIDAAEDAAIDVSDMLPPESSDDGHHDEHGVRETHGEREPDHNGEGEHEPREEAHHDDDRDSDDRREPEVLAERVAGEDPRLSEAPALASHDDTRPDDTPAGREPQSHERDHSEEGRHEDVHQDDGHRHASAVDDHGDDHGDGNGGSYDDAPHAIGLVEEVGVSDVESVDGGNGAEAEQVETVASESEDALEELPSRPRRRLRSYKIQEVIKRRQVILVQVVKEERGTKGAALTTYLSLAGRYTVLMPNTARGGGISRKITNAQDRKRLKAIAEELDVEEGMGLIIRTAGASRTKQEIKRDYEYLLRLWESVRDMTLASVAPTLVYEEGNLIKRSIRDLYGKEVDEVIVAGDAAYREASDFMRMLMPSHVKNVIDYRDPEPLFSRYQIERQLNAMFSPYVHLRSGGYLVINQTEALVSIDINSGKSTREFSIEETALSTNLEAADEIARQLKLRDLAGLIVIDFIDMEEKRNNRNVERRLKDALRFDRARIQVGRISHFGLLEMSRQRMRTGVLEGSTTQCPHCQGTGIIRSTESVALAVLRGLEDALMAGPPASLIASTTATVALYILNNKRAFITEMESRYGITIQIVASDKVQGANFGIEKLAARRDDAQRRPERAAVNMDWGFEDDDVEAAPAAEAEDEPVNGGQGEGAEQREGGRRRRRRRGRGRRDEQRSPRPMQEADYDDRGGEQERFAEPNGNVEHVHDDRDDGDDEPPETVGGDGERSGEERQGYAGEGGTGESGTGEERRGRRGRRRGRRGGRRGSEREPGQLPGMGPQPFTDASGAEDGGDGQIAATHEAHEHVHEGRAEAADEAIEPRDREAEAREAPVHLHVHAEPREAASELNGRGHRTPAHDEVPQQREPAAAQAATDADEAIAEAQAEPKPEPQPEPQPEPPARNARANPVASEPVLERVVVGPAVGEATATAEEARPARRGWWRR